MWGRRRNIFLMIFVTDYLNNSKKIQVWYFTVDCFESLRNHAISC